MLGVNINQAVKGVVSVLLELTGHVQDAINLVNNVPTTDDGLKEWLENVRSFLTDTRAKEHLGVKDDRKLEDALGQIDALESAIHENYKFRETPYSGSGVLDLVNGQSERLFDNLNGYRDRAARYLAGY